MLRIALICTVLVLSGLGVFWLKPPHFFKEAVLNDPAYRADRLFQSGSPNYDSHVHRIAQRIEWGEALTLADLAPIKEVINQRHGEGITLLFHAITAGNTTAVDALLAAGADPYQADKPTGSSRNFVYFLTLPGGSLLDIDGINTMIASYLRHGGDPNGTFGEKLVSQGNLTDGLAGIGNIKGLEMVVEAGGDPWMPTWNEGERYTTAMELLGANHYFDALDRLIDQGLFTNRSQPEIHQFLKSLGGYAQRRDEPSREIQRIAMRVLKRNPDYVETDTVGLASHRIFKNHWQDPLPGVIPWEKILSDAVK